MVEMRGLLHEVNGKLYIHVTFYAPLPGMAGKFSCCFSHKMVTIIGKPICEGTQRGIILCFGHSGIIKSALEHAGALEKGAQS
ncbi:hypothetical protein AA15669_1111 [Saccharibacter floricola DSM 15669]|uniref:Uncharacterized protein n=1 Tax=Saccharibacter floricola DSM 15669 TaxID=1123227 RepID=A0ABQ0NYZ7_9PROT|nr:hypothetical protein AA15669_1111 [Saccharibacter floricola DSM 15669]